MLRQDEGTRLRTGGIKMSHGATSGQPIAANALRWLFFNLPVSYWLPFNGKRLAQKFSPPQPHDLARHLQGLRV